MENGSQAFFVFCNFSIQYSFLSLNPETLFRQIVKRKQQFSFYKTCSNTPMSS